MKILILTEDNLLNHVYNKWELLSKGISKSIIIDKHIKVNKYYYDLFINPFHKDGVEIFNTKDNKTEVLSNIDDFICNTKDLTLEDALQLTKIKNML